MTLGSYLHELQLNFGRLGSETTPACIHGLNIFLGTCSLIYHVRLFRKKLFVQKKISEAHKTSTLGHAATDLPMTGSTLITSCAEKVVWLSYKHHFWRSSALQWFYLYNIHRVQEPLLPCRTGPSRTALLSCCIRPRNCWFISCGACKTGLEPQ